MEEKLGAATIGGLLAAIAGGVIWKAIVMVTDLEIGYMAWGIGFICGFAVLMFTDGEKGHPLPFIASCSSVLGIVIGKYLTFFDVAKEYITQEYGAEAASRLSVFSLDTVDVFLNSIGELVDGFDVIWVVLAVVTAWRISAE